MHLISIYCGLHCDDPKRGSRNLEGSLHDLKRRILQNVTRMSNDNKNLGRVSGGLWKSIHPSSCSLNCGTGNSSQWWYYRYREFCNTCPMKRYKHGCLVCPKPTSSRVAYCLHFDFKICSEIDLGYRVLMDVFHIIRESSENRLEKRMRPKYVQGSRRPKKKPRQK